MTHAPRGVFDERGRGLAVDDLECPKCSGHMKLVAMVTAAISVRAYLRGIGELCDAPERSPVAARRTGRAPCYAAGRSAVAMTRGRG